MKVYLDITLLPGADIDPHFLLEKVYKQIHLGLATTKMTSGLSAIGISFPGYNAEKYCFGTKLRLLAPTNEILEHFDAKKWLNCLSDYVHITGIRDVSPNVTTFVRFKRMQSKSSIERLARRKAKRAFIEFDEALKLLQDKKEILLNAPFIKVSSSSSGQNYRLFIIKEQVSEQVNEGFSCYGLSATSTLPDF